MAQGDGPFGTVSRRLRARPRRDAFLWWRLVVPGLSTYWLDNTLVRRCHGVNASQLPPSGGFLAAPPGTGPYPSFLRRHPAGGRFEPSCISLQKAEPVVELYAFAHLG